jgi:hypothetical protein
MSRVRSKGNHSNLSKIIGKSSSPFDEQRADFIRVGLFWKTLPPEERGAREAKAVITQAEHRKRHLDWRIRPGANAIASLKFKTAGEVQLEEVALRPRIHRIEVAEDVGSEETLER